MMETVDGEYQNFKAFGRRLRARAFLRQVRRDPRAGGRHERRRHLAPDRGGHDPHKVYAAYAAAVKHTGSPP
jgi:pyruvate dehydrogenase E1 component